MPWGTLKFQAFDSVRSKQIDVKSEKRKEFRYIFGIVNHNITNF
jgi:hypothetical protein